MTLEEILKDKSNHYEEGIFGLKACRESIVKDIERHKEWNLIYQTDKYPTNLYVLLEEFVNRANSDILFNKSMVVACWQLINGR